MKGHPPMSLGRVLIVDDDPGIGPAVERLLQEAGFKCCLCTSPADVYKVLGEFDADFALIDLHLGTSDPNDGENLYDQLERDFPRMEMAIFTSKDHDPSPHLTRKTFEIPKYDIGIEDIQKIESSILKGVNRGLQKRLAWQSRVMASATIRLAVLDEKNKVVWENAQTREGAISKFLKCEKEERPTGPLIQALNDRREFEDVLQCDGDWLDCKLDAFSDLAAGEEVNGYRLLTTRVTTRQMKAANLTQELLAHDSFDKISDLICTGLVDLGFRRIRLWILEGDNFTLALYREKGHGLSPDDMRKCKIDFRKNDHLLALLGTHEFDARIVHNPTAYLPPEMWKILKLSDAFQTLAIPLFVRDELLGLLTVDKAGLETAKEKSGVNITHSDRMIGKQIGRLAAAALERGIHEWQFQRVQDILSQTQLEQPDDKIDEIYKPVFDKIVASLGNDAKAPWLPRFRGAEIAVRYSRFARSKQFFRIHVTEEERTVFPPLVDITEGLIGEVMSKVEATPADLRRSEPIIFRNIFSNAAFRKHYLKMRQELSPRDPYIVYLQHNPSKGMIPLLDLDKELLGFLCFHAPIIHQKSPTGDDKDHITHLHRRWLEVLGQLCSRILEIRERHHQSVAMSNQLYKQVASKEAMAEFGEMSASITHEIKQYFQRLLYDAELLRTDITQPRPNRPPLQRVESIVEEILSGSERLTTLNDLFKDISGGGKSTVSVSDAVDKTLQMAAKSIQEANAEYVLEIPTNIPPLPLTLDQSLMILTILVRNACDSIREVGREKGRLEISAHWEQPKLTVTVKDNGGGIAPENLPRLFQLGFTTKRSSRNMGVGLSLVRRMVGDHKGVILVESTPNQGATFRLEFTVDPTRDEVTA